jgi:hypothetical protein
MINFYSLDSNTNFTVNKTNCMKKFLVTATISFLSFFSLIAQNIGIGTNTPNGSAALDVNSTSKGLLIPRMTSAQRGAIASPATGLMVYDITTNSFWYYNGSGWTNLTVAAGSGTLTLPYDATVALTTTAFKIKNDEYYNAIEGESTYGTGLSGKSAEGPGVSGTSILQNGVYGYSASGNGVYGKSYSGPGLFAYSTNGAGINATSENNSAVFAATNNAYPTISAFNSNANAAAVKGTATGTGITNTGVEGKSTNGYGVDAGSVNGTGLRATSTNNTALFAQSESHGAIAAINNSTLATITAENQNLNGESIHGHSDGFNAIVGTTAGTSKSGIRGEATGLGGNGVFGTSNSNQGHGVYGYNLTGIGVYGFSNTGTGIKAVSNSGLALDVNGKLKIAGGNTNPSEGAVLTSDAAGNVVWKNNRIAFCVKGINPSLKGIADNYATKLHFNTEEFDYGNTYALHVGTNPTTNASTFTIPKDGVYNLGGDVHLSIESDVYNIWMANVTIRLKRAGVVSTLRHFDLACFHDDYWSEATGGYSTDAKLLAGDIIWIEAEQLNNGEIGGYIIDGSFYAHLVFED